MSEFNEIFKRADNIIGFLLYGTDTTTDHRMPYQRIQNAKDKLFNTFESLSPVLNRNNETLVDAVMDFAMVHNEVYLEIGLLLGLQMAANLEETCQNLDICDMLSKCKDINMECKDEHPLQPVAK